jgi:hypothetical protein
MHHSFDVLVLNILLHVSAFKNDIIRESYMNMLRCAQFNEKQRRMGAVYCDRRRNGRDNIATITPSVTIYSSHPSLLFMTLGTISACSYRTP